MAETSDSERQFPPAMQGWWAVGIFCTAAVLSYTDRQILSLLVDPLRADLHVSDTQLSILQGAAFAVLYSCVGLPLGRMADILKRKALLLAAVTIWSIGTAACGLAESFWQLFAARLLVGIGEAAFAPAAMSLIADYFPPERRATAIGVFFTGIVIGAGSAIAIGGGLLEVAQHGAFAALPLLGALAPWRVVLLLAGSAGALVFLLLTTLREPVVRSVSFRDLGQHLALAETLRPFARRLPLLFPLYAAMALCAIVDYGVLSWTPAMLSRRFGYSPLAIGASLGTIAIISGVIGTPAGGYITDWCTKRWGAQARPKLAFAIVLFGIFGAPIGFATTSSQALLAVTCWVFVSSVLGIVSIATVLDLLPTESRGFATSTISFSNTIIGLGLGPTLVALASDHIFKSGDAVGLAITMVAAPAILLACAFYYLAIQRWDRMVASVSWNPA